MTTKRLLLFTVGLAVLIFGEAWAFLWFTRDPINRASFQKIAVGMTEQEVVGVLGLPPGVYCADDAPFLWPSAMSLPQAGAHTSKVWSGEGMQIVVAFSPAGRVTG